MFSSGKFVDLSCVFLGVLIFSCGVVECEKASGSRPHIILIVGDDVGWNDVSFHGANEIPTPNIDALAYNGIILNRQYVLPSCTPSRTALMTGRYTIREGLQGYVPKVGEPRGLRLNVTLLPEHLRQLGYETKLVGKWHLGYTTENYTPTRRGFDTFFGYYNGILSYFNKTAYATLANGTVIEGVDLHRDGPEGFDPVFNRKDYFTDLITDEAERIIQNHSDEKPLFLEISHLAVHGSASNTEILEVRNETENDETFSYIKGSDDRKYAGMMKAMDDSIGRVVKALADAKMLENSIVIFISDNGAPTVNRFPTPGSNYPLRGVKATLYEGGVRGAACIFSPLISNASRVSEQLMHVTDWLPTLYSAAGGDASKLEQIDGVDLWDSLVKGSESPRKDLLLNINELTHVQAAMNGRFKLVEKAESYGGGYYGRTGNDASFPAYDAEKILNSLAGRAISRLSNFNSVSPSKAGELRENAVVKCEWPTSYPNCSTRCLFDIVSDPCETQDLSKSHPEELKILHTYIQEYWKVLVPQKIDPFDLCALPRYFNGTWSPWRRDDANQSTIVPESICRANSTAL